MLKQLKDRFYTVFFLFRKYLKNISRLFIIELNIKILRI